MPAAAVPQGPWCALPACGVPAQSPAAPDRQRIYATLYWRAHESVSV